MPTSKSRSTASSTTSRPASLGVRLGALVILLAAIGAAFAFIVQPWYLGWGATPEERTRRLPGDEIIPDSTRQQTRAITVNAPIDRVWPWLAQIGQDRGGFYSYDLLENLVGCEMPVEDRLRPDRQVWSVGDKLWMYPSNKAEGRGFATLRVYEPGRALAFGAHRIGAAADAPEDGSWTLIAEPLNNGQTRLIFRGRGTGGGSLLGIWFDRAVFDPVHFVMERRTLIGIKQLAEIGTRSRWQNDLSVVLWTITFIVFVSSIARVAIGRDWRHALGAVLASAVVFQTLTLAQPNFVLGSVLVIALVMRFGYRRKPDSEVTLPAAQARRAS